MKKITIMTPSLHVTFFTVTLTDPPFEIFVLYLCHIKNKKGLVEGHGMELAREKQEWSQSMLGLERDHPE